MKKALYEGLPVAKIGELSNRFSDDFFQFTKL